MTNTKEKIINKNKIVSGVFLQCNVFSVLAECKQLGIKLDQGAGNRRCIEEYVQKVMDFFFLGKSHCGRIFSRKSKAKVMMKEKSDAESKLFKDIEDFCDGRLEECPIIISCDDFLEELCRAISEPYLVVTSDDLNSCSYAIGLGKILLQDRCNIFMSTTGLSKTGKERLSTILKEMTILFDNRVRVILFGSPCVEDVSEKRFENSQTESSAVRTEQTPSHDRKRFKSSEQSEMVNSSPIDTEFDTYLSKGYLTSELNRTKEKLSKAVKEKSESDFKVLVLEKDNASLLEKAKVKKKEYQSKVEHLEGQNSVLLEKLKFLEDEKLSQARKEKSDSDRRIKELEEENSSLRKKSNEMEKGFNSKLEELEELNSSLMEKLDEEDTAVNHARTETEDILVTKETDIRPVNGPRVNIGCQTKKVALTLSPLSFVLAKLEKDESYSTSAKVYSCIKNFDCSTQNRKGPSGRFHCKVKVTNGKHILEHPELLNFEGEGSTMAEAKEVAFEAFITSMREEAEN